MSTLKEKGLTNWHLVRIMRLGIGVMLVVMAIQAKDWAMGLFGGFFLYQALTNTGCCGSQECYTPSQRQKVNAAQVEDTTIEYEEIK